MQIDRNKCFFCSEEISEKKTKEHIIPNSLLGKMSIKNETIKGRGEFTYSRLKVRAHSKCNSEFGSRYESEIIEFLENPNETYQTLINEEQGIPLQYGPDNSVTSKISTWLMKIYYGIFYNDYLKVKDEEWKIISKNIIDTPNFNFIRKSYKNSYGFYLTSSLYSFKSKDSLFDLKTLIFPQTIMMQIDSLIFILNIEDGYLVRNYLNLELLTNFRYNLIQNEKSKEIFPTRIFALSELVSLRMCIPKSPKFMFSDNEITNNSLSTMVTNPEQYYAIDNELLNKKRKEVLLYFGITLKITEQNNAHDDHDG